MKAPRMKSVEFRRERQDDWQTLETLIDEAERKGLKNMSAQDVSRLPRYYRAALSSLSVARSISLDANLLLYLENLSNRAFIKVYGVRHHLGEAFAVFLTRNFPRQFRHARWLMLLSTVFFLLGLASGFVQVMQNSDSYYNLVNAQLAGGRTPAATTEELRSYLFSEDETLLSTLSHFSTYLFTHNAQVGILSFALGFVLGLPVFYLLFTNGQMLGGMAALYHQHGLSVEFWGWILPHGVTEISALLICGGAGLILAQALLIPGRSTRLRNLAREGRKAGLLVLGTVVMFFLASLLEGFFRQLVLHTGVRYTVAGSTLVFWVWFFVFAGRKESR